MIVVLADDLSGAAEMGGVAYRYGLRADVVLASAPGRIPPDPALDVDVLVIDTDSRSCSASEAMLRTVRAGEACQSMPVEWIFKKVDSVLRGNIVAELAGMLTAFDRRRALLIPANPALGRTISRGDYFVDGVPLHQTDFANDPEYPALTSDIVELLTKRDSLGVAEQWPVCTASSIDSLPDRGICVGETTTAADLAVWAHAIPSDAVASGAADFFGAMLDAAGYTAGGRGVPDTATDATAARLYVCGSTSAGSRQFCRDSEVRGIPVLRLPPSLLDSPTQSDEIVSAWAEAVVAALQSHATVIVAIDQPLRLDPGLPHRLTGYLSDAVEKVLANRDVNHLLVEGGATAAALIRRFGWDRLQVLDELAPGVVSVQVAGRENLVLTMKPGSYAWPDGR